MDATLVQGLVSIVTTIIVTSPAIIYARAALKQGQSNGVAQAHIAAKAETAAGLAKEASMKTDVIIEGNKQIHTLVNSGNDKLKADLATANERIDRLTATVERLLGEAAHRALGLPVTPDTTPVKVEVTNTPLVVQDTTPSVGSPKPKKSWPNT